MDILNKSNQAKVLSFVLSSALILFYIADGLNKFIQIRSATLYENGDVFVDSFSVSIILRFIYEGIFIYLMFRFYDRTRGVGIKLMISLLICFIIGQIAFLFSYQDPNYSLTFHLVSFNKYMFIFIIYYAIKDIIYNRRILERVIRIFESIYLINSLLIFFGISMQITFFKSYFSIEDRYGYNGLVPSINEATLFYMIGISVMYFKYLNSGRGRLVLWISIAASLLMGAKAMYLFLLLLLFYHLIFKANIINKFFFLVLFVFLLLTLIPLLLSDEFGYLFDLFLYQYERNGLLSAITSGRSEFVKTKFIDNLDQWNLINIFFGGTDQFKFYIEMDFLDAFLLFGVIGLLLLLLLYFKTIFNGLNIRSFRLFFCISFFLIAFLAGHFFASASNALYLDIAMLYMYSYENKCAYSVDK